MACVDQLSKAAVLAALEFGQSLPVLPPLLRLTLWRNTGIAFGLLSGASGAVGVAAAVAAAWLVFWHRGQWHASRVARWGTGLILGGAAGNLLDRARYGYVVDFVELPHWPIFNLADACIVAGGVLLATSGFRDRRR